MVIVQPADRGASPVPVRKLTFDERRTLLDSLKEPTYPPALLLDEIHQAGNWVACDCRQPPETPLLHTRQLATGTIVVVRMHSRPHHAPGCAFAEGLTDHYADTEDVRQLEAWTLDLMHEVGVNRVWEPDAAPTESRKPSLWTALRRIGAAATKHANPFGETAGSFVSTYANGLPKLALQLREDSRRQMVKPIGFMFAPVVAAAREGLVLRDGREKLDILVPVRGPIRDYTWAKDDGEHIGLAAMIIRSGTDGRYEPTAAVRIPVARYGHPIPVPSYEALAALRIAKAVCKRIAGEADVQLVAHVRFPEGLGQPMKIVMHTTKPLEKTVQVDTIKPRQIGESCNAPLYILPPAERPKALREDDAYAGMLAGAISRRLLG